MSDELNHILQELTTLNRHENAKVALRARQVSDSEPRNVVFCFVVMFYQALESW